MPLEKADAGSLNYHERAFHRLIAIRFLQSMKKIADDSHLKSKASWARSLPWTEAQRLSRRGTTPLPETMPHFCIGNILPRHMTLTIFGVLLQFHIQNNRWMYKSLSSITCLWKTDWIWVGFWFTSNDLFLRTFDKSLNPLQTANQCARTQSYGRFLGHLKRTQRPHDKILRRIKVNSASQRAS